MVNLLKCRKRPCGVITTRRNADEAAHVYTINEILFLGY
jgi:hypothetical protein